MLKIIREERYLDLEPLTEDNAPSEAVWKYFNRTNRKYRTSKPSQYILNSKGKIFIIYKKINEDFIEAVYFDKSVPSKYIPLRNAGILYYDIKGKTLFLPSAGKYVNIKVEEEYRRHGVGLAMLEVAYRYHDVQKFLRNPISNPETEGGKAILDAFEKLHPELKQ